MNLTNGELRRWQIRAATAVVSATLLTVGTVYLWPFVKAVVHHAETIIWVNEVHAGVPYLVSDHHHLVDRLNGATSRDRAFAALQSGFVDQSVKIDRLLADQQFIKGQMAEQAKRDAATQALLRQVLAVQLKGGG